MTASTRRPTAARRSSRRRPISQYPESRAGRERSCRPPRCAGVRRGARVGPRSGGVHDVRSRRCSATSRRSFKRDTVPLLVAAEGGAVRARLLPDVKDDAGRIYQRARAVEQRARSGRPVSIDPDTGLIAKQTFVPARRPAARRGAVLRLPRDRRRAGAVHDDRVCGRPGAIGERHSPTSRFNTPLDPALFKRPSLDDAPAALVRRAVRRPVCRRADARAARDRSRT